MIRILIPLLSFSALSACVTTSQPDPRYFIPAKSSANAAQENSVDGDAHFVIAVKPVSRQPRTIVRAQSKTQPKPRGNTKVEDVPMPVESEPDSRCESIGRYAKAVTNLRDIGIPKTNLGKMDQESDANFPGKQIQEDVYIRNQLSPDQHEKRVVDLCREAGYNNLNQKLKDEEAARKRN